MPPSREVLQNEFASKIVNDTSLMNKLIIGCAMSDKYSIDIRRYLWNVAGIQRNVYENVLPQMKEYGVKYFIEVSQV